MGFVYLITNDINDKKYVGITTRSIEARWKEHLRHNTEVIGKAIEKYGKEHFQIEKIEECSDLILDDREQYWIKYYDSYNNGYNATIGGRREKQIKYPEQFYEVKKLWEEGFGQKEIVKITNLNVETVHNYLIKNNISDKEIRERASNKISKAKSKPIIQFDLNMNIIKEWKSILQASQELNINRNGISNACNNKRKEYKGFIWRFKND